MREGYAELLADQGVPVDARDPMALMLFPEMDERAEVPEITEACWDILHKSPDSVMCASSRMESSARVPTGPRSLACTLLPYDPRFELGATLAEAAQPVRSTIPTARASACWAAPLFRL